MGASFLVCHGAWSAGWAWKKMHPLVLTAPEALMALLEKIVAEGV